MKNYITILIILLILAIVILGIVNEMANLKYEVHLLQKIVGGE